MCLVYNIMYFLLNLQSFIILYILNKLHLWFGFSKRKSRLMESSTKIKARKEKEIQNFILVRKKISQCFIIIIIQRVFFVEFSPWSVIFLKTAEHMKIIYMKSRIIAKENIAHVNKTKNWFLFRKKRDQWISIAMYIWP